MWELLPDMNEAPFKIFFWINETKIDTKAEDQVVVSYKGLHIWTLALGVMYHGDKIRIFAFDSGNILNMFEIQKYWRKISETDDYFHSKIYCLTLDLLYTAVLGTISFFQFVSTLNLVYLRFILVGFEVCIFVFVNKTKFVQVLRTYTYLSKSY